MPGKGARVHSKRDETRTLIPRTQCSAYKGCGGVLTGMVRYITCGGCVRWVSTFHRVVSPSDSYLISGACAMRPSWLGRLSVSRPMPFYMVAALVHPSDLTSCRRPTGRLSGLEPVHHWFIALMMETALALIPIRCPLMDGHLRTRWTSGSMKPLFYSRPTTPCSFGPWARTSPRWLAMSNAVR